MFSSSKGQHANHKKFATLHHIIINSSTTDCGTCLFRWTVQSIILSFGRNSSLGHPIGNHDCHSSLSTTFRTPATTSRIDQPQQEQYKYDRNGSSYGWIGRSHLHPSLISPPTSIADDASATAAPGGKWAPLDLQGGMDPCMYHHNNCNNKRFRINLPTTGSTNHYYQH